MRCLPCRAPASRVPGAAGECGVGLSGRRSVPFSHSLDRPLTRAMSPAVGLSRRAVGGGPNRAGRPVAARRMQAPRCADAAPPPGLAPSAAPRSEAVDTNTPAPGRVRSLPLTARVLEAALWPQAVAVWAGRMSQV